MRTGFTLTEFLIVVVVFALLALAGIGLHARLLREAVQETEAANLRALQKTHDEYMVRMGRSCTADAPCAWLHAMLARP